MALKTDYKDDIPKTENRRYQMIHNDDGTVSFVDVTEYTQVGDTFGAGDVNATNESVNGKVESTDIVDPALVTQEGFAADALKVKQALNAKKATLLWSGTAKNGSSATLNNSIENFNWIVLIAKQDSTMKIYSIPVLALTLQETNSSNFLTHCLPEDNSISVYKGYTNKILSFWMSSSITLQKIYGC